MRIAADGKVGIGTNAPTSKLHTYVTADHNYLTIENSTANQAALQWKTSTTNADWIAYIPTSSSDLRLYSGGDLVTFKTDGKVGIGTSPVYAFEVVAGTNEVVFEHDTHANGTQTIKFNPSSTKAGGISKIYSSYAGTGATEGKLALGTYSAQTALTIDNGGRVGINNTSPSNRFEVSGTSKFTGNVNIGAAGAGWDALFQSTTSGQYWEWDASMSLTRYRDNTKAVFGNGDDLKLYHDGSNSHIKNTGSLYVASETSGDLYLRSDDDIFIQPQGGENGITLTGDGAVTLYHDNAVKLATNSGGVTVTGTAILGGASFVDNATAYFGTGNDLRIYHDGNHSYIKDTGTGNLVLATSRLSINNAASNEEMISAIQNGAVELFYANSKKLETTSTGVTVTGGVVATSTIQVSRSSASPLFQVNDADAGGGAKSRWFGLVDGTSRFAIYGTNGSTEEFNLADGGVATFTGAVTANAGINIDNININGTTIALSSGDLTIDVAGNISLDADGNNITLKDGGIDYGNFTKSTNDFVVQSTITNGDILFKGSDGGSAITALSLNMSDAGTAIFNHDIKLADNGKAIFGGGSDLQIYHSGADSYIVDSGAGDLYIRTSNELRLQDSTGTDNFLYALEGGDVRLYYDGAQKLATTSTGITVTGAGTFSTSLKAATILDASNSAGTSGQILTSTGSALDWKTLGEISGVDGTGTAGYLSKWD